MKNLIKVQLFALLAILLSFSSCTEDAVEGFVGGLDTTPQLTLRGGDTDPVTETRAAECTLQDFPSDIVNLSRVLAGEYSKVYNASVTIGVTTSAPEYGSACVIGFFLADGTLLTDVANVRHPENDPNSAVGGSNNTFHRMMIGTDSILFLYRTAEPRWHDYNGRENLFIVPTGNDEASSWSIPFGKLEYRMEFTPWTPITIKDICIKEFKADRDWILMVAKAMDVHWSKLEFTADFTAGVYQPNVGGNPFVQTSANPNNGNTSTKFIVFGVSEKGHTGMYDADGEGDYDRITFKGNITRMTKLVVDGRTTYWHFPVNSTKDSRVIQVAE